MFCKLYAKIRVLKFFYFNLIDHVKFGDTVHSPPEFSVFPKKKVIDKACLTIPSNAKTKSGVTEKDRNEVIQRYRIMKTRGKFNI